MAKKNGSNIRQIAEIAGVSVATVSRVLNPPPGRHVAPELHDRIMRICDENHYYPNMHTVRMFSRSAGTVAMLAPADCMYKFVYTGGLDHNLSGVICGVEMGLAEESLYLTLVAVTDKFVTDKEYLKLCRGKMVDGIIVWGWYREQEFLNELLQEDLPVVMTSGDIPPHSPPRIEYQDYEGMRRVVEYVLSQGHRKIAVATPGQTCYAGRERLRGINAALKAAGVIPVCRSKIAELDYESGIAAGNEILDHCRGKISCIIAGNDYAAFGVAKVIRERGLRIPEDISVTGADGIFVHGQMQQMTSFCSPSFEMGKAGAKLLVGMLHNDSEPVTSPVRLPVKLIPGDTVATLNP
jgi:DNA-binding LacI/PurR family transcriptional regulator